MALTDKQREARTKGIGSSDMAALFGLDRWRNQHDVWRVKKGYEEPFDGNAATRRGDLLEPALLQFAEEEIGERVVKGSGSTFVEKNDGILRANIDGFVGKAKRGSKIVECKSSLIKDGWGEPGTDQVPPAVTIQVHHQMVCAESDFAYVAHIGERMEFSLYHVPIDPNIARRVQEYAKWWWEKYIEGDDEPPTTPTDATMAWFENMDREDQLEIEIDDAIIGEYEHADQLAKAIDERKKHARLALLRALGDASKGVGDGRYVKLSHVAGRTTFDSKAFKQTHPDLFEQFSKTGNGHVRLYVREMKEKA